METFGNEQYQRGRKYKRHPPKSKKQDVRVQDEGSTDGYGGDDTATASQVRKHYEKKFRERKKSEAGDAANLPEAATVTPFQGSITSVFSTYLS